jgi:hypothetical protein
MMETVKVPEVSDWVLEISMVGDTGVVYTAIFAETGSELPTVFLAMTYIVYVFAVNPVFTYETIVL